MKVFVIYGQGGVTFSYGMYQLCTRLNVQGYDAVTREWAFPQAIVNEVDAQPASTKVALIGYSLGANCATWIASGLAGACRGVRRGINLLVAYDPTRQSPLSLLDFNVKRAICFYNRGAFPFGGAKLEGPTVEIVEIATFHLAVSHDERLHQITIDALEKERNDAGRG